MLLACTSCVGGTAFFISGLVVAFVARAHQLQGTPMRKLNGGLMPYQDGYLMTVFFLLMSILLYIDAFRKFKLLRAKQRCRELAQESS
jgi:hypothetical protein